MTIINNDYQHQKFCLIQLISSGTAIALVNCGSQNIKPLMQTHQFSETQQQKYNKHQLIESTVSLIC